MVVLDRPIKTGVTPHKSKADNVASRGQFLPYHTTVTDESFMERSTCSMMCSFPPFSLNIITQPRPDTLEKKSKPKMFTLPGVEKLNSASQSSLKHLVP